MNRKIIFRGYNIKNKKWLYGYYLVNRGQHFIAEEGLQPPGMTWEDFEVDPESVGQYAGDYEGKPIFEGDELMVESTRDKYMHYFGFVKYDEHDCRFVVELKVHCGLNKVPVTGYEQICKPFVGSSYTFYYKYKVIGNEYEEKLKISNP